MGKLKNGLLGCFYGKIGPVVGYRRFNQNIVRSLPCVVAPSKSAKRKAQQRRFAKASMFCSVAYPLLKKGFIPKDLCVSSFHRAFSLNYPFFKYDGDRVEVAYSKITISKGELKPLVHFKASVNHDVLSIRWRFYRCDLCGEQRVQLLVFDEQHFCGRCFTDLALASDFESKVKIGSKMSCSRLHLYLFYIDPNGKGEQAISGTSYALLEC